jgi:hypothetical protein
MHEASFGDANVVAAASSAAGEDDGIDSAMRGL